MMKKVRVTNEMQDLRTEEDSLEPRQEDKWSDQLGGVGDHLGIKFAREVLESLTLLLLICQVCATAP